MSKKILLVMCFLLTIMLVAGGGIGLTSFKQQSDLHQVELDRLIEKNETLREEKIALAEQVNLMQKELADSDRSDDLINNDKSKDQEAVKPAPVQDNYPGGSGPIAYLTFDDGPSKNTLAILDILARQKIQGTFFVTGNNVSGDENVYNRIVSEGHVLGNHTFTHSFQGIYQSTETFLADFTRLEEFLYNQTGVRTNIMRFPGGSKSVSAQNVSGYDIVADLILEVLDHGYDYYDWNVSSGDGTATPPRDVIVDNVLLGADRVAGDIIILFHDSAAKNSTVEALPEIIDGLKNRGYSFAPLHPGAVEVKHKQ